MGKTPTCKKLFLYGRSTNICLIKPTGQVSLRVTINWYYNGRVVWHDPSVWVFSCTVAPSPLALERSFNETLWLEQGCVPYFLFFFFFFVTVLLYWGWPYTQSSSEYRLVGPILVPITKLQQQKSTCLGRVRLRSLVSNSRRVNVGRAKTRWRGRDTTKVAGVGAYCDDSIHRPSGPNGSTPVRE